MIGEGAIDNVDAICGLHVGNLAGDDLPTGTFVVFPGPVSAGNADLIPTDEPNWVGVDSHINAMYPKQIRIMRPSLYNEDEDIYYAIEPEDAVIYCKELIERYNLKYIGENTIHDNCKADGI